MDDRSAHRPAPPRAESASQRHDISELVTHVLGPARAAERDRAAAGSGMQRLQGAEAFEREAARLQAQAQTMEQHLWACSQQLEQARARYQLLHENSGATGATSHDLEQAHLDMESYASVIIQVREDYLALLHRASQYLAAAAILRDEDREPHNAGGV
jgi:hypothetical protein